MSNNVITLPVEWPIDEEDEVFVPDPTPDPGITEVECECGDKIQATSHDLFLIDRGKICYSCGNYFKPTKPLPAYPQGY